MSQLDPKLPGFFTGLVRMDIQASNFPWAWRAREKESQMVLGSFSTFECGLSHRKLWEAPFSATNSWKAFMQREHNSLSLTNLLFFSGISWYFPEDAASSAALYFGVSHTFPTSLYFHCHLQTILTPQEKKSLNPLSSDSNLCPHVSISGYLLSPGSLCLQFLIPCQSASTTPPFHPSEWIICSQLAF